MYIEPIIASLRETAESGPIAGFPMLGIKVSVVGGSYLPDESNEVAYRVAASRAFREASSNATPVILEPIMDLEIETPEEYMGELLADLQARRAHIKDITLRNEIRIIKAEAPLYLLFGYVTKVRSLSQGRASFIMQFLRYDVAPKERLQNFISY
jgi:elongation factor G